MVPTAMNKIVIMKSSTNLYFQGGFCIQLKGNKNWIENSNFGWKKSIRFYVRRSKGKACVFLKVQYQQKL